MTGGGMVMTLQQIMTDIHALTEDLEAYERKYGVLSETFYESYTSGEEPGVAKAMNQTATSANLMSVQIRIIRDYP